MRHENSIVIHRDEHGNAKIWVVDYPDDGSQAVEREIDTEHPGYRYLLAAIDVVTGCQKPSEPRVGHRADVKCDKFLCLPEQFPGHYAAIDEGVTIAEDQTDTKPLTGAE